MIPSAPSSITGGCYCGAIRFTARPPALHQVNCHCANCRRAVGAQAVAWITVARSALRFDSAPPLRYRTDTGAWRTFCPQCGTSLTYEHDTRPDDVDITVGCLDRPEDFPPTRDYYVEEKLSWVLPLAPPTGAGEPHHADPSSV